MKAKPKTVAGLPADKALALGERMYREGILPSGEPMQSVVSGDVPVAGTAFTCVSCHVRSGLGTFEGGVVTLPTNGTKLGRTRYRKYPNLSPEERKSLRVQTPAARPPYTDASLAHVLRTGLDPGGRELNPVMPRYDLKDPDMAILVHYLWSLSAQLSPGVDTTTLRVATVITDEVSAEDQEAMLVPMNNFVARHNAHASVFGTRMYMSIGGQEMRGAYRKLALSVWRLKGPSDTWASQLGAHLAKEPVFALLGGISYGDWKPIHTFCESRRLPCLFPITDFPVISDTDWYTQYFSKGYFQEGQAAARYLRGLEDPAPASRVLQIIQDGPEGRDLSAGFRETWQELGAGAVKEIRLGQGETVSLASLRTMLQQEKPTAVLLWTAAGTFDALDGLADEVDRPGVVIMSSRQLGTKLYALPEKARAFTWITYPYRDPKDEPAVSRYANSLLAGLSRHKPETRISTRTYALLQLFQAGLIEMDRNVYRDNLLDRLGMQRDHILPDFLRLSFGPGQRYASKGCYLMQLSPGPEPKLVRKSEWVVH
ncbi:MAG: ABC transporter substrate-binding protein [Geothrix sp.]|nr:ABC transporter substrate-binding protein [Geothrix sp.]